MMLLAIAFSFTACGSIDNPFKDTAHVHDFDEWEITKKPTCTEDGEKVRYCSCGEKQTEIVVSLGHSPAEAVVENMVKATCTVAGSYDEIIYCNNSNCNEKISTVSKVIDATGHSFGEWITVKAPTSTEEGLKERTCQCGEKQTETIQMTATKLEFELNSDGASYSVIGIGDFTDTELVLPDTYNGYPVTEVRSCAFQGNSFITSVTTGGNIRSIEAYAFESCSSLKTVIFSDSLERLGENAFSSCHKLEDLIIGKGFEYFPLTAFYYCFAMSNIEVDEKNPYFCSIDGNCYDKSVTTLIRYSPGKTDQSFVVPESVTNIGPYALTDAQNLISVVIPNGVKNISDFAFYYCNNLTSIVIPNSVSSIGVHAFGACSNITEVYYIGDKEEWEIIGFGNGNSDLTGATCYFYSEDEPTAEGNFWHYVDGAPTVW